MLLKTFETLLLLRLCLYTLCHRDKHVHHTHTHCIHIALIFPVVSTLEHITEQCCSPKPWSSFKKHRPQWAEYGVDPEILLFLLPDTTDSCSRCRSGTAQSHV